eukprot:scaffold51970_cov63-Phaeocystis_antarctica.AAC.1
MPNTRAPPRSRGLPTGPSCRSITLKAAVRLATGPLGGRELADALQHPRHLGVLQAGAGGLEPVEEKEQQTSRLDEPVKRYHLTEAHGGGNAWDALGGSSATLPNRPSPHCVSREIKRHNAASTPTIFIFSAEPLPSVQTCRRADLQSYDGYGIGPLQRAWVLTAYASLGRWR